MLEALYGSALGVWVRESPSIFAYTLVLSLHAIGLAIVVGIGTLTAARLLGFVSGIPLGVLRQMNVITWTGFVINAISGLLLFVAEAPDMARMPAFWGKIAFVVAGMYVGQRIQKQVLVGADGGDATEVSAYGRRLAKVLLVCWFFALVIGRLTGYPELVHQWFGI